MPGRGMGRFFSSNAALADRAAKRTKAVLERPRQLLPALAAWGKEGMFADVIQVATRLGGLKHGEMIYHRQPGEWNSLHPLSGLRPGLK